MVDRTGRSIDSLSLRDLCDLCEYRLLENATDKNRARIRGELDKAARSWERTWAALHPLPTSAVASVRGLKVRQLLPAGPDGMAVGHSPVVVG